MGEAQPGRRAATRTLAFGRVGGLAPRSSGHFALCCLERPRLFGPLNPVGDFLHIRLLPSADDL